MKFKKLSAIATVVAAAFTLSACVEDGEMGATGAQGAAGAQGVAGTNGVSNYVTIEDVVTTNANIAYAVYSDSVISAKHLRTALEALVENPTEATFADAKSAWLASREPYGQSEVYRFRNGPIDALKGDGTMGTEGDGPEGAINAWPLGEALIDYTVSVDGDQDPEDVNKGLTVNIVANEADYPTLNKATILSLAEFGGDERNVATGYHAVEFLLWGQDLNDDMTGAGARDGSAGQRKVSDFYSTSNGNTGMCTSGAVAASTLSPNGAVGGYS